ncbi:MAG: hypothetical protein IPP04_06970 [Saprospiraceae bacterium]|nr:hypothetical protein [Saprospiraceae bacterium]
MALTRAEINIITMPHRNHFNSLMARISENGGMKSFESWTKSKGIKGFGKSNIYKINEFLNELDDSSYDNKKVFNGKINKLKKLEDHIEEFSNEIHSQTVVNSFNRYWNLYFFHTLNEMPKIGKASLELHNQNKQAFIKNVPDRISENYAGIYSTEGKIICLDLKSEGNAKSLYIKAHYFSKCDNIMLGAYITTDDGKIVNGSIIFQSILEPQEPKLVSSNNLSELEEVPLAIRKYLSVKWRNYHKILNKVFDTNDLSKHVNAYKENWNDRFVDISKPMVYFGTPSLSIDQASYISFQLQLKSLEVYLANSYHNFEFKSVPAYEMKLEKLKSVPDFSVLSHAHIFILLITRHQKGSFSLVQLGWALAHCKNIIVFYEEGSISKTILRLSHINNKGNKDSIVFHSVSRIEDSWEFITLEIEKTLNFLKPSQI